MSDKLTFHAVLVLLALCGMIFALLRHMETGIPLIPGQETTVWLVEARVDFVADGGPLSVSLSLAAETVAGFQVV